MAMFSAKRLGKELQKAKQHLPPGLELVKADDFSEWQVDIRVLDENPLYKDEIYRLRFRFGENYPIQAPEVTFLHIPPCTASHPVSSTPPCQHTTAQADVPISTPAIPAQTARPVPIHPHIYSNGIICLDLLGSDGWSPVQSVESVCMSIQSMLTGNTKNERPPGDEDFCRSMAGGRRVGDVRFIYDDATV